MQREVRASGLHGPPHCGRAHVTICHVSPQSCRGTRYSKKRVLKSPLDRSPELSRPSSRCVANQASQFLRGRLGETGVARRSVGSHSPHFENSTDSLRNVSRLSSCYSRVYNPWKSPWKASNNFIQVAVSGPR